MVINQTQESRRQRYLPAAPLFLMLVLLFLVFLFPSKLMADTRISTEIGSMLVFSRIESINSFSSLTHGSIDLRSAPSPMVQGRLQLRATGTSTDQSMPMLHIPRAYIRFRFPIGDEYMIRINSGRDRLSWGIGNMFNAADLIFGADGRESADLSSTGELRDETTWLLSLYFPIGPLSYLEGVILPQEDIFPRAGMRIHSVMGPISLETAYLYDKPVHRTSLSLQGSLLGADIYTAAMLTLPESVQEIQELDNLFIDASRLSAGLFRTFAIAHDQSLNSRLEIMIDPADTSSLIVFPELIYLPDRSLSLITRALITPSDGSLSLSGGAVWNIFQGFNAVLFTAWQRQNDMESIGIIGGFSYAF